MMDDCQLSLVSAPCAMKAVAFLVKLRIGSKVLFWMKGLLSFACRSPDRGISILI
jgi:hypothetical protein